MNQQTHVCSSEGNGPCSRAVDEHGSRGQHRDAHSGAHLWQRGIDSALTGMAGSPFVHVMGWIDWVSCHTKSRTSAGRSRPGTVTRCVFRQRFRYRASEFAASRNILRREEGSEIPGRADRSERPVCCMLWAAEVASGQQGGRAAERRAHR